MTQEISTDRVRSGRNECGQRAAAEVLSRRIGGDARLYLRELRESHPPDTPLRLLGTTPRRVAHMLRACGLPAELRTRASQADLRADAIACVDLRVLEGRGLPRLHWAVIDDADAAGVRIGRARYAWARFLRAWECRASPFPMHRRAIVLPTGSTLGSEGNAFPSLAFT